MYYLYTLINPVVPEQVYHFKSRFNTRSYYRYQTYVLYLLIIFPTLIQSPF